MALIECKACSTKMSKKAKSCPQCGEPNKQTSPVAMGCLIIIIFFVIIAMLPKSSARVEDEKKIVTQKAKAKANPINVTAPQLVQEYKDNEVRADNKYKGKWLKVSGTVSKIGKDILNKPFITISSGEKYGISSVQCYFKNTDLSQLNIGDGVSVTGKCEGKMMNILLRDCE